MVKNKEEIINRDVDWDLEEIMADRFGRYSKYIIQERALPDARDGLKPVQRRILFAMHKDGNTSDKPHRKSAKTVGLVIGTYHPHGDTSVYEAMVRMSQDWKMNSPLIDMHGNNGSIDDDPPAAMRYTEARLSAFASNLLADINFNTVKMTNNYDDTELEPTVLPASFPLLLVNGATGIASGYATNIAPHNLNEIIDATIYRLLDKDSTIDDLLKIVKGPDFPTGGIVQGKENIAEVFKTGKGKVIIRARTKIEEKRTINQIIIDEIPYEVIKSDLVKQIDAIRLNKEIEGMSDVRDESDRNGLKIVIDIKKNSDSRQILNYLFKNTDLQINYNYNMIAIENHRPVLMNLLSLIDSFIAFRREVVLNRTNYLYELRSKRMHILEGLIKAISILDDIIELIRQSKDKADAIKNLKEAYLFSFEQAEAIVNMRLYRLSNTDILSLKSEYNSLNKEVNEYRAILSSEELLKQVIVKELKAFKEKNGKARKTTIENDIEDIVVNKEAMIANETVYISLTRDGYIRRYSERAYSANDTLPYCKEDDAIVGIKRCETLDTLLIFLSNGEYAKIPVYAINECKYKDLGIHYSRLIKGGEGKIVSAIIVKSFINDMSLISITKKGMVKRTLLAEFNIQRSLKTSLAMKLKTDDALAKVLLYAQNDDLLLIGDDGYYNRFNGDVLTLLATKAMGVKGINLKDSFLADALVIENKDDDLLLFTTNNCAKRIHLKDLPLTSRAIKGNRLFKQRKSSPYIVKWAYECSASSSFFIGQSGNILNAKDINIMDTDSSFSKPLELNIVYLLSSDNSEIKESKDLHFLNNEEKEKYAQLALFANEDEKK